jgi:hypothetical protein
VILLISASSVAGIYRVSHLPPGQESLLSGVWVPLDQAIYFLRGFPSGLPLARCFLLASVSSSKDDSVYTTYYFLLISLDFLLETVLHTREI